MLVRQLRLCKYPDCVKTIQELNERLYSCRYPLKCIAPLFPISTRNLHFSLIIFHLQDALQTRVNPGSVHRPLDFGCRKLYVLTMQLLGDKTENIFSC